MKILSKIFLLFYVCYLATGLCLTHCHTTAVFTFIARDILMTLAIKCIHNFPPSHLRSVIHYMA